MKIKQTISKISELSSNIKQISNQLFDEKELNKSDILTISDLLEEIDETSQKIKSKSSNIFAKASAMNISSDLKNLYGRLEEIENKRLVDDEGILSKLHEISYKQDYLDLNFYNLNPTDVENILVSLDYEINEILTQKPFNEKIILPLIEKIKSKYIDLQFRYDFPIIDELDENKNSFAHRLLLIAKEISKKDPQKANLITNKVDELLDLVWISKMFIYGNNQQAQNLFEKFNPKLKEKIKQIIWRVKGKVNETDQKWLYPCAMMNYVSDVINA